MNTPKEVIIFRNGYENFAGHKLEIDGNDFYTKVFDILRPIVPLSELQTIASSERKARVVGVLDDTYINTWCGYVKKSLGEDSANNLAKAINTVHTQIAKELTIAAPKFAEPTPKVTVKIDGYLFLQRINNFLKETFGNDVAESVIGVAMKNKAVAVNMDNYIRLLAEYAKKTFGDEVGERLISEMIIQKEKLTEESQDENRSVGLAVEKTYNKFNVSGDSFTLHSTPPPQYTAAQENQIFAMQNQVRTSQQQLLNAIEEQNRLLTYQEEINNDLENKAIADAVCKAQGKGK